MLRHLANRGRANDLDESHHLDHTKPSKGLLIGGENTDRTRGNMSNQGREKRSYVGSELNNLADGQPWGDLNRHDLSQLDSFNRRKDSCQTLVWTIGPEGGVYIVADEYEEQG